MNFADKKSILLKIYNPKFLFSFPVPDIFPFLYQWSARPLKRKKGKMSPGLHTSSLNNEEVSPGVRSELESGSRRFQPLSLTPNDHFLPLPSSCWAQHLFGHSMRKREEGRDREDTTKHARPLSSFLSSTAVWLVLRCLSRFLFHQYTWPNLSISSFTRLS